MAYVDPGYWVAGYAIGDVLGDATAAGASLSASSSLTPGEATATGSGIVLGINLVSTSFISSGAAIGDRDGIASGADIFGVSFVVSGTATGLAMARAPYGNSATLISAGTSRPAQPASSRPSQLNTRRY